jgi:hypothetical protein
VAFGGSPSLSGRRPVPDNVAKWLRQIRDGIDTAGLPEGWHRPGS